MNPRRWLNPCPAPCRLNCDLKAAMSRCSCAQAFLVQDALDLHGATRIEAAELLSEFLAHSLNRGHRCLRIIHGKGLGSPGREPVLKHLVRSWLARRDDVLAFCQARPTEGGEGALVVLVRGLARR